MLFQRIYSLIYYGNESSPNSHYEKFILTGEVKCIDDEIPFELPKGWEWCRLGEVAEYRKGPFGSSLTKSMFVPFSSSSIKVYEQKNAIQKDFSLGEYYITEEKFNVMSAFRVLPNDIIVSCAGTIGETYILPMNAPIGIINQALMRVSLFEQGMSEYWRCLFEYVMVRDSLMKGSGSAIKNIPPFEYLKNILIPLPPLAEQQRIVAKIEELMPLVEQYGKAQSELNKLNTNIREQLKKSILQYAIEGKLVPQCEEDGTAEDLLQEIQAEKQRLYAEGKLKKKDLTHSTIFRGEDNKYYEKTILTGEVKCIDDEIPFELPNGWEWCRLGEVALVTGGYAFSSESLKSPQGIRVVRISDFNEQEWVNKSIVRYDGEDISSQYEIHINDLLLAMTGGTVGKSFFVQEVPEKMYLNQRVAIIRSTSLLPEYINVHLKSLFIIDLINSIKNSTNDNISMRDITSFTFPLPPLAEQQRIVDKIKLLFDRLK